MATAGSGPPGQQASKEPLVLLEFVPVSVPDWNLKALEALRKQAVVRIRVDLLAREALQGFHLLLEMQNLRGPVDKLSHRARTYADVPLLAYDERPDLVVPLQHAHVAEELDVMLVAPRLHFGDVLP